MSGQHRFAFGSALGDAGATTIASLPVDLVATQVLSHLSDPMDLAVLRAVSKGMRAAVDATGREIAEANDPQHAADRGFLTTLRHMHSRGRLKSADVNLLCYAAAKTGQLVELKALRAENWPWSEMTCANAAKNGHLEVLKWAREKNCPWDEWTCADAAMNGHLEVLKWLREKGCPWNEDTCSAAAQNGHLEVLQWARENDCPWDETTLVAAVRSDRYDVLRWVLANGCPCDSLNYH